MGNSPVVAGPVYRKPSIGQQDNDSSPTHYSSLLNLPYKSAHPKGRDTFSHSDPFDFREVSVYSSSNTTEVRYILYANRELVLYSHLYQILDLKEYKRNQEIKMHIVYACIHHNVSLSPYNYCKCIYLLCFIERETWHII